MLTIYFNHYNYNNNNNNNNNNNQGKPGVKLIAYF